MHPRRLRRSLPPRRRVPNVLSSVSFGVALREALMGDRVTIGTLDELRRAGCLTGKAGTQPICVFWSDGARVRARRPLPAHGLPAAPGHRRERPGDLPLAQRPLRPELGRHARSVGRRRPRLPGRDRRRPGLGHRRAPEPDRTGYLLRRLEEGLEQGITLVIAKAVLGLLDPRAARATSCAPASTSAPATARRAGARGSPC